MSLDYFLGVFLYDLLIHGILALVAALIATIKYRSPGAWGFFTFTGGLAFGLHGSVPLAILAFLVADRAPDEVLERGTAASYGRAHGVDPASTRPAQKSPEALNAPRLSRCDVARTGFEPVLPP